jgi:CheY-like chemotaxis protein
MGKSSETPCLDLMLLDLNLPSVDGPEILKVLRRHPTCSRMPVIVFTSSDAPKDKARVDSLGISHYFLKPEGSGRFHGVGPDRPSGNRGK